ncbi:hypothetical protein NP233_g1120 [Leucocoprinus birnbaumii]|uniref:Uncharacterized protein n=1 Tax=Leucocoprinus birnbaumii TaxID=56174 RepID=A0AAD5W3G7_9AGAR|nr:hypothetical protein NP233_g1120 [Leucocoprinus birnbaumii]
MSARYSALYSGTVRKLVLAFDVGTTYSGISYAILDPGRETSIKPVTRFPSRAKAGGDAKVPTVIYYSSDGLPQSIGADTEREGIDAIAEDSQWIKAEWFKLHLRPKTKATANLSDDIPPLPRGKTAVDIFADYLTYLYKCAQSYIKESETHADAASLLASGKVEFILSHPNAWEGAQQTLMRSAAVQAGLITSSPIDRDRVTFISEGEASLNFCIDKGLTNESIEQGKGVTIVDAGGGTLDISTYALKTGSTVEYEEIAPSQSYFKGSVFVTRAASNYLNDLLKGTRFQEDVPSMTDKFDKATKLAFRDPQDPQYIKFGGARDRDEKLRIRTGQLRLDGEVIAGFFKPSIECIVKAVQEQRITASKEVTTVYLVGGFAGSDYLFSQVQERLESRGVRVYRPDAYLNKAVADGAIVGLLRPKVRTRIAKFSYGVRITPRYLPYKRSHLKRSDQCVQLLSVIKTELRIYQTQGTSVSETQEFRKPFFREGIKKSDLDKLNKTTIIIYRGNSSPPPEFLDEEPAKLHEVFEVHADLTRAINSLQEVTGSSGNRYFKLYFDIVILFGATEFKAQYAWYENGVEKRLAAFFFTSNMSARHKALYSGTVRKLVLAFDVGTTYSGISYAILDPGRETSIKSVTRFPSRAKAGGDAKVPTVIYYSSDGLPQSIGADTEREGIDAIIEDSQWIKAEWFKLHLRPKTKATANLSDDIPPLPRGKTAVDIFADYLTYLYKCAQSYIKESETHADAASLLASGKVEFILSHPNAWEGAQQTLMRSAAVQAGLITSSPGDRDRVTFISEGEASLNFCIDKGLTNESIEQGKGVTIVDAGGGTLDISTYALKDGSATEYEEIAASQYLLKETCFQDDVPSMTDKFDKATKLAFRDPQDPQYIKFGSARDRDQGLGIRAGQLRLDGKLIAGFFEPSIECIVEAVQEQQRLALKEVTTIYLVGGFAGSDYLFSQVQERLESLGLRVYRPDAYLNKAVADGAIVGLLRPKVRTRIAKYSYGVRSTVPYIPHKKSHLERSSQCVKFLGGDPGLSGSFGLLLEKVGTKVFETQEFRDSFCDEQKKKSKLNKQNKTTITVYRGSSSPPPEFIDQEPEKFHAVFKVHADLTRAINSLKKVIGSNGDRYFQLNYDIVILFGATEFKAQYAWYEDGIEKR